MSDKRKIFITGGFALSAALLFTGCAAAPQPDDTTEEVTVEPEFKELSESEDTNSVVRWGENGVVTITTTLNNEEQVECVAYDGGFECFPELSTPR